MMFNITSEALFHEVQQLGRPVLVNDKKLYMGEFSWSNRSNSCYYFDDDRQKVFFSECEVVEKKKRSNTTKAPCTVLLEVDHETEKAYAICKGTNGKIGRGNTKVYYDYVAKSICEVRDGKVYAPAWAV